MSGEEKVSVTKRGYLPAGVRRALIVEAASRPIFAGLNGLTMVAVAKEAGVSQQSVYDHFPDLRRYSKPHSRSRPGSTHWSTTFSPSVPAMPHRWRGSSSNTYSPWGLTPAALFVR